jgi:DNA-binding CsgD family transcriptional regulator
LDRHLLDLADSFMAAALDQHGWIDALQALAEVTRSSHAQLIGLGSAATVPFNFVTDLDEAPLREFVAIDGGNPDINYRVRASIADDELTLRTEEDYAAMRPLLRSDTYVDYAYHHDIPYGCQTKLIDTSAGMIGFALLRGARDGKADARVRNIFTAIAPHVRSAVRTQIALEESGPALLAGALDKAGTAVFVLQGDGRIMAMTGMAEIALSRGLLGVVRGRLEARDAGDTVRLHQALARHATGAPLPLETVLLPGPDRARPVLLDLVRAARSSGSFGFRPHVLAILRGAGRWHARAPAVLTTLYRLSPGEADVALRLAEGVSRSAIAEARGSSLATVRAQLKSIFAKVGVEREAELIVRLRGMLQL